MYVDSVKLELNFYDTNDVAVLKSQLKMYEKLNQYNVKSFPVTDNINLNCDECIRYIKIKILRLERKKKLENIFENENL
jgi:hypothetical protein